MGNAVKNITRSGTTFTATKNNGGTFTFTQQDNNTTYSNATTSTAGLMSSSDKSRVNNISDLVIFKGYWRNNVASGGTRTFTETVPSGYKVLGDKPVSLYASGIAGAYCADRGLSVSGSTITISAYVYSPSGGNLNIGWTIPFIRNI